jgi:hypothetical protein
MTAETVCQRRTDQRPPVARARAPTTDSPASGRRDELTGPRTDLSRFAGVFAVASDAEVGLGEGYRRLDAPSWEHVGTRRAGLPTRRAHEPPAPGPSCIRMRLKSRRPPPAAWSPSRSRRALCGGPRMSSPVRGETCVCCNARATRRSGTSRLLCRRHTATPRKHPCPNAPGAAATSTPRPSARARSAARPAAPGRRALPTSSCSARRGR